MIVMGNTTAAVAVVLEDGYAIGLADEGVKGYTPTSYTYDTYELAGQAAKLWNERAGHTPERASAIVLSTMSFGRDDA